MIAHRRSDNPNAWPRYGIMVGVGNAKFSGFGVGVGSLRVSEISFDGRLSYPSSVNEIIW